MERRLRRLLIAVGLVVGGLAAMSLVIAFVLGRGGASGSPSPSRSGAAVPRWASLEHLPRAALRGAALFRVSGCTACHTYAGSGQSNLGAPDLTAIGTRGLGAAFEVKHLECPSCVVPDSPMPPYATLGKTRLHELAVFLEDSKGTR